MDEKKTALAAATEQLIPSFVAESRDLLQQMEDSLLTIEAEPDNADAISAVFRAAHTIKGNAGVFGFDDIVAFTHVVESLLDEVRAGVTKVEKDLVALLLSCRDHIEEKLDVLAGNESTEDREHVEAGASLVAQLRVYLGQANSPNLLLGNTSTTPCDKDQQLPTDPTVANQNWHISLRMGRDSLRNGMDPISIIVYLTTLGEIAHLVTLTDAMPSVEEMDPESCYLGFEIDLHSDATKSRIEEAFKFIQEDSIVQILPPHSKIDEYVKMIGAVSAEHDKLGEILVASGSLTQRELDEGLALQRTSPTQGDVSRAGLPLGQILVGNGVVHPEVVAAALGQQQRVRETKRNENKQPDAQYLRVRADKLDQLINRVGELVIAGAGANLIARRAGDVTLQEATSIMSRLVEEIREDALSLRMVQIGETFNRFHRVVRDVSNDLGKDVTLLISGAETELDKTVVEKIADPLMHLVRNALDHGIESLDVRRTRGKPDQGTLRLNAYHDSGSIVIEVSDDGGGLNKDRILEKAVEREIVTQGQHLSDSEIYNLVFEPGFSTADQVTNLSGRGVGMDVVRRNIEALRGTVELHSELGTGTTVRIRLPLTLAIIDGFLVGVGANSYVIPLDTVVECVELDGAEYEKGAERGYVNLRGRVLPCLHLRQHFNLAGETRRRENIVVVNHGGHQAGFVVDELLGEFQTVIKPLGRLFAGLKGISGSTILGTGDVALIVDVPALIQLAVGTESGGARRNANLH